MKTLLIALSALTFSLAQAATIEQIDAAANSMDLKQLAVYAAENPADYNKAYVKNIENKKILNEKVLEIEKRAELPSIAAVENRKNFTEVQQVSNQSQLDQQKVNDQKIVDNANKIVDTRKQITDNAGQNSHSTENDLLLKNSVKELGTSSQIIAEKSNERAVAAKETIDEIESKQPVKTTTGAYEVDLTKYKEGVNQEQFDQVGSDGLVSAIVTRRVVVIDGKANIYIRTQTMNMVTYQKNGEPTTESTWQKETQDATRTGPRYRYDSHR